MRPMFTLELDADEYLRVVRSRLDMTQAELAERLGVDRRTVMRYETGIFRIPQARLREIERMAEEVS